MTISIMRLQAYLRHRARQPYDTVAVPPFTLFLHPSDPFPHFNYAIPIGFQVSATGLVYAA